MMSDIDYNALAQALDTTWGRSSTPKSSTFSVKFSIQGPDQLSAMYMTIVNFGSELQMVEAKRRYEEESLGVLKEVLKSVKSTYKDLTGSELKTKELTSSDSLEVVNMNFYNSKRTAYYRRKTLFELA